MTFKVPETEFDKVCDWEESMLEELTGFPQDGGGRISFVARLRRQRIFEPTREQAVVGSIRSLLRFRSRPQGERLIGATESTMGLVPKPPPTPRAPRPRGTPNRHP